jgi:hypothetical protein
MPTLASCDISNLFGSGHTGTFGLGFNGERTLEAFRLISGISCITRVKEQKRFRGSVLT